MHMSKKVGNVSLLSPNPSIKRDGLKRAPYVKRIGIRMKRFRSFIAFVLPALLVSVLAFAAQAEVHELPFWSTKGAETDSRVVGTVWSGCGDLLIAKVRVMPNPAKGDVLGVDEVYELDSRSRVKRKWRLPANSVPVAFSGNQVVVKADTGDYLIGTDGSIQGSRSNVEFQALDQVTCKLPRAFKGSAYASCVKLPSIDGKSTITLAMNGPCT